jgi:DNA-binding NtrC family response regulator
MQGRIILLVEDDVIVRSVASEALQDMGWQVEEAGSSSDAEVKFRSHADAIKAAIIDIGLPDRKGDDLARDLRRINDRLPIALVTGYGTESLDKNFTNDPFVAYLGKPYDLDELETLLERFGLKST